VLEMNAEQIALILGKDIDWNISKDEDETGKLEWIMIHWETFKLISILLFSLTPLPLK